MLLCSAAAAQTGADAAVRPRLENVTTVESWSFFAPQRDGADPTYTLFSNRARLGVQVEGQRLIIEGSFQYAQLFGLPRDAFGPGPFGPGALYFAASRTPEAFQLYMQSLSLTLRDVLPDLSLRVGRMPYNSDDGTAHQGRLIGTAEWTPFQRSFDGVRADYSSDAWSLHAAFLMPTQGAFEESASPTIGKVQVGTASLNAGRARLFAHNYRDTRAVAARPDNTGIPASAVDVNIQTLGGSASLYGVQLWGAWQRGRWYSDAHRAFSVSADAGHIWSDAFWRPGVRAGAEYSTGDSDPNDRKHGTFFPILPTTRPNLLRGTYAQMNLRDLHIAGSLRPNQKLEIDAAIHHLSLAHRQDRWYTGTGATAFRGEYFGFSSRPSTLRTGLGTFVQLAATTTLTPSWKVSAATGIVRGGDVVTRQFAGRTLWVMTLESAVSLP
jgi:hypothetical protein